MNLLLSEQLPLRTTRALGDYVVDAVLAHRYGDLRNARFPLVQLAPDKWFVADHPMDVSAVYVDDEATEGWEAKTESDGAGHTWTVVNLAAAAPAGAVLSAAGQGKRNPTTGGLYENPAEIMEDVAMLAGRTDTWPALRAECAAIGLRIAGSVDELLSIQSTIDGITEAIGAIWTTTMARLYPVAVVDGPVLELSIADAGNLKVSATLVDTADILRLSYDVADATSKPQHYIELSASPKRYGGVVGELVSKWLRQPADAETVGRATLQRMAGDRYDVSFSTSRMDIRPGTWWKLVGHPEWPLEGEDPVLMILTVYLSPDDNAAQVTAETILARPLVTVTAHSIALPDTSEGGIEVTYKDGIATIKLLDKANRPMAGARVSLDKSAPKTTDSRGLVTFKTTPGQHTLDIEAVGYQAQSLVIKL